MDQLAVDLLARLKADTRNSSELARITGVSQPTISRFRTGSPSRKRNSDAFNKLCDFYKIPVSIESEADPSNNQVLLDAVRAVWDGTEAHAQALARVIRSLKGLGITQAGDIEVNGGQDAGL